MSSVDDIINSADTTDIEARYKNIELLCTVLCGGTIHIPAYLIVCILNFTQNITLNM